MNKNVIMGVVAALALGGALFMMMNNQQDATSDDAAEGLGQMQVWVCRTCNEDTRMSKEQWINALRTATAKCQSCGSGELADAVDCPHCGRGVITIGHGRLPSTCPRCNQALGPWRDVGDTTQNLPDTQAPVPAGR